MPSLRQKVTTYFRQLSFIAEPRDGPRSPRKTEADEDGNFITKYLEGRMERIFVSGPEIYHGQNPTDLPDLPIGKYATGPHSITAACTGPDEGLTGIKRSKLHLSASYADDIDFIDTTQETDCYEIRHSITSNNKTNHGQSSGIGHRNNSHSKFNRSVTPRRLSNANANANDQNANKPTSGGVGAGGMRSRKNSRTSISNLNATNQTATSSVKQPNNSTTTTNTAGKTATNSEDNSNQKSTTIVVSMVSTAKQASTASNQIASKTLNEQKTVNKSAAENGSVAAAADGTTKKLLENTTERLLREAVSNQSATITNDLKTELIIAPNAVATVSDAGDTIAGVSDWRMETEYAYGISVSLYENNMLTKEPMGNPIADCYGIVVHDDAAAMALADGVNWGDGARLAARSAVHGCLDYLDRAIFGLAQECMATTTQEVFVSLLRSLWEGHGCILEVGGALSTLTIAVVLPLSKMSGDDHVAEEFSNEKYVICACNVGDSLGYVYSKKHGVREFTQASHDIQSMRDMRDALGALGPADGNKPELSNLTFSMTVIDKGDIVFLTSDGVSDNFDPVVGKFAEAWTPDVKLMSTSTHSGGILAPKRQNKSASAIYSRLQHNNKNATAAAAAAAAAEIPIRPPRSKKSASPENVPPPNVGNNQSAINTAPSRPKYMRSHTVIEPRRLSSAGNGTGSIRLQHNHHNAANKISPKIPKSISGLPLVTGPQRHALTLYRLEDLLSYGINGTFSPCVSARRLCHLLIDFVRMITSARRKTLEQRELFYKLATGPDGIKREVEMNRIQHRAARKRVVDSSAFVALPGKLDHATVVAFTVGSSHGGGSGGGSAAAGKNDTAINNSAMAALQSKEFQETNF